MGLKLEITKDYVLGQIDDFSVFSAYFGDFSFKKAYPSVFRKDDNPSTGFYIGYSGRIIYNDIATGEKLDCFAFVAKKFNLSYKEAVNRVACDFGLIECGEPKFTKIDLKKANRLAEEVKKETIIKIVPDSWGSAYLDYWNDYGISQKELEDEEVYPIKKLYVNDNLIPNYDGDIRFAYIINYKDKSYKKIYSPHAVSKKFKWMTNVPIYLPFGFDSLSYKSDTLVITKAQKDRILLKKFLTDVIAVQNESPSALRDVTIDFLKKKYKRIYYNSDSDDAGRAASEYFETKGLEPLTLPDSIYQSKGIKDLADLVKECGVNKLKDFLTYKKVI